MNLTIFKFTTDSLIGGNPVNVYK